MPSNPRAQTALLALLILLTSHNLRADELVPPPNKITPIHSPDGVTFQAYEWGNPSGRPIVFIHGIYQSALSWIKQIGDAALVANYRLIAIDLRGHGASDKPASGIPVSSRSPPVSMPNSALSSTICLEGFLFIRALSILVS
jgi:alpha/beta hydrolase fold